MKKLHLVPLLALCLLLALCATASAATMSGQVAIAGVTDAYGAVSTLTDDNTATTWTQQTVGGVDLTLSLYSADVSAIWIRSGHCYSQQYYNHYDRPDVVKVTVWYRANQYTTSSDTYRYRLSDSYRPNTYSSAWNSGYQRLLLPKAYQNVTSIELTIESSISGYGATGATLTDIIVTGGSHATATPRAYATSTPRPYVVYVTPTPNPNQGGGYVEYITPVVNTATPTRGVVILTPEPTRTSNVELLTPVPETPINYPSLGGIEATLLQRIATRTGPSNNYDEPGTFFSAGDKVKVISKGWDEENALWWFQVEFQYGSDWYRAYTPAYRIDLDPDYVPSELTEGDAREVLYDHRVYFGPGEEYKMYKVSMLYEGSRAVIYAYETDPDTGVLWAQIEYHDYAVDEDRRGWVPVEVLSDYPFAW